MRDSQGGTSGEDLPNATSDVGGVPVAFWNPIRDGEAVNNFGDAMSPELVARMAHPAIRTDIGRQVMMAQGSILHFATPRTTVWGTGVNGKELARTRRLPRDIDVRAVRGPWTRRLLEHLNIPCPGVYGDPASLTARLYPELTHIPSAAVVDALCAPNLHDMHWLAPQAIAAGMTVLNPRTDYGRALQVIARSRFVVGTSLHAIIVAESFGIPARILRSQVENPFKYRDYLAGSGRPFERIAEGLDQAVEWGGGAPAAGDLDALAAAFPHDLWSDKSPDHAPPSDSLAPIDDSRWVSHWENSPDHQAQTDSWNTRLSRAASTGFIRPDALARDLVQLRTWFFPDVEPTSLDQPASSVDAAARSGADRLVPVLEALTRGLEVVFYDCQDTARGRLAALALFNPTPSDPPLLVRLSHVGWETVELSTEGLTTTDTQVRIDLDVLLPPDWQDPATADCVVTVLFASGATKQASRTSATAVPPFWGIAPQSTPTTAPRT